MTDTKTLDPAVDQSSSDIEAESSEANTGVPEYLLHISADRVCVLLDCPDPASSGSELVDRILSDFQLLEIPEFPDAEIMKSILDSVAKPGVHLRNQVIMMGEKQVPSVNGSLNWTKDYFAEGWAVDEESGAVNFWEKLENRSVTEDELLVTLTHPVEGSPGLNVFGLEIPVSKPEKVKLRSGKNVRTAETETGVEYYSTCNGRVRLADGTVSVDDLYVIKGNVGLETGNIQHTGAVMIQGDIAEGAVVEADGDIMIKGMVEPCRIRCGGTLTVAGGILGEEEHQIDVGGDLLAKYISEANITAGGNILVTNEVAHSNLKCLGTIKLPKGRIAGGSSMALKGIWLGEAGSSAASDTKLITGVDYTVSIKIDEHKVQIKKLEQAQNQIKAAVEQVQVKTQLTDEEKKALNDLNLKNNQVAQAIADQYTEIQKLKNSEGTQGVLEIIILKELWAGTTLQCGQATTVVRRSILKPRLAQFRRNQVKVLPLGEGNMPGE